MNDTNHARTTTKSLAIIEQLIRLRNASLEEVSTRMEIPKSTMHGHLKALEAMGYVTNDAGTYEPTLQFLYWGNYVRNSMPIFDVARPEMKKLTEKTRESTSLVVETGGKAVIVYNVEGQDASKFITTPGTRTYLHTNASGKAMLGHMPRERVKAVLDRHGLPRMTDRTVTDRKMLFAELERVEDEGYAVNHEGAIRGMSSVAAPVVDTDGTVVAAVAVFGPSARMSDKRLDAELSGQVLEAANVIEVNYNYE